MSTKKRYNITCPACGHAQDVELYESVKATDNSGLRQAIMENRLNRVECEDCGDSFRVDMPLLYNDPVNNVLIHWMPALDEAAQVRILEEFDQTMEELNDALPADFTPPRVRLVFSRVELVEMIFMIEAGMNERVVEYVKYSIYTRNLSKIPPEKFRLLLNVHDSTDEELCFVMQDMETKELKDILRYGRAAYESLCEMFETSGEEFFEMFPGPYISAPRLLLDENESVD
ncbi:MAG: CpXC domain-containing protein [Kiritimatiellales bacterium]|nr:CpXC domain-containing protein [Kiritimatiellales bacterium]